MNRTRARRAMRVGIVGCGDIARDYAEGSAAFDSFDIVACSDLDRDRAQTFGEKYGIRPHPVAALISSPEIDVVLNLTPPGTHAPVIAAALAEGKHVYTEKPLATTLADGRALVAEAERRDLRIGCAPDMFLGAAYQAGREVIARGEIGTPIGATATMLVGGPDAWHPNADFFYGADSGPMLDLGPYYLTALVALLGPIAEVVGLASTPTSRRKLAVGPRAGHEFDVEVPTYVASVLRLESGAIATFTVSFEAAGQYISGLVVHGSRASLELPDANDFGGEVRIRDTKGVCSSVPYTPYGAHETRGLGLQEMVLSLCAGRPHRATGALGLHVLDAATAIIDAAADRRTIRLTTGTSGGR